jgi:pyruvate formate lyase activating enzyme
MVSAMSEKGLISTIQRYSTKDGPGIRSTVFCVGCNLRCKWCSNPELMISGVKYMYFENRCIHCGACVKLAANNSIRFAQKGCEINRKLCTNIEECLEICPKEAYEKIGYEITSEELVEKLLHDRVFYEQSGGGVTFSGGEAALQGEFIAKAAHLLRVEGIHTALDTAGCLPWTKLKRVVEAFDMVLYDIKAYDGNIHKACTGVGSKLILENARHIAEMGKEIIIRMVIVPGWNDDLDDIKNRITFIKDLGSSVVRLDILKYHKLGVGKYHRIGLTYPIEKDTECNQGKLHGIKDMADFYGLNVHMEE